MNVKDIPRDPKEVTVGEIEFVAKCYHDAIYRAIHLHYVEHQKTPGSIRMHPKLVLWLKLHPDSRNFMFTEDGPVFYDMPIITDSKIALFALEK